MQTAWAVLSLILPAISAGLVCRRLPMWESRAALIVTGLVLYVLLHLLPVHLLAALEILHVIDSVNVLRIAMAEVFILLVTISWVSFSKRPIGEAPTRIPLVSFLQSMPMPIRIAAGILGATYIVFAIDLFTSYPGGWDGVNYHLPLAVQWLQEESLRIPPSRVWLYSMPGNAEIGMMLLLGIHWPVLAVLMNWVSGVVLACSAYLIALKFNVSRPAAFTVTLIILSMPIVQFQTFSTYIDLYGSSFFMAGIALFLYRYEISDNKMGSRPFLLGIALSGVALGIAIGTKSIFYAYAGVIFIAMVGILAVERHRHGYSLQLLIPLVVTAMLVPSAFWFGRALLTTGNPFYPFRVEVPGVILLKGHSISDFIPTGFESEYVQSRAEWIVYPWREWKRNGISHYGVDAGLGAAFATFVLLGVVFTLSRNLIRRQDKVSGEGLLLVYFVALMAVWWFVLHRMPRYGLPLLAIACILAVPLVELFLASRLRLFGILLICSIATTCMISGFVPFYSVAYRVRTGDWTRAVVYGIPKIIDEFPEGSVVLNRNIENYNNFALAGECLCNTVIPWFESPQNLDENFIKSRKVDYVIERGSFLSERATAIDTAVALQELGLEIICVDDSRNLPGLLGPPWRVWKLARSGQALKSEQQTSSDSPPICLAH